MMRKKAYFYITIILTACLSSGCAFFPSGSDNQPVGEKSASGTIADEGKIKITYAQWSVPSGKLIKEVIDSFNSSNSGNVNVEAVEIPLDRYIETINLLNSSGQAPDVFEAMEEWITSYVYNNYVADLSKFIKNDFFDGYPDWIKEFIKSSEKEGTIFSLPSTQITYRLIYNKELFEIAGLDAEKPPRTLKELKKYAKIISDSEKGQRKYGFAIPMGDEWLGFVQPMEAVSSYSGINFYDFNEGRYNLSVYKPWLSAIKELDENGGMFPGMRSMKSELALTQFAQGNIGMMYVASWQASMLFGQLLPEFDWGIAIPPAIDEGSTGKGKVSVKLAGWNVISSASKNKEAAFGFWKYLYSDECQGYLFKNGSAIPLMDIWAGERDYQPENHMYQSFMPGSSDAIYSATPMIMDEWPRIKVYLKAVSQSDMDTVLLEETNRLNVLLNTQTSRNAVFTYKTFKPHNPWIDYP